MVSTVVFKTTYLGSSPSECAKYKYEYEYTNMNFDKEELDKVKYRFEDISDLDAKIIYLREDDYLYKQIQLMLGNPSKKYIRSVLMKYVPQLLIN